MGQSATLAWHFVEFQLFCGALLRALTVLLHSNQSTVSLRMSA